ncbi:hypothetical protein C8N40_11312 [Pontibacter mucosus]|uniref:MlpB protein n=1 Tax=Pontibacter mucosus TaxID=1649266 RepID=A0A2T5Y9L5_9BACT|nr:hypothetical protein [Pontibacter mucosus]PTX13090.1 hypothetical protein C8N40_11312 [Pontibacter mucosus]
MKKNLFYMVVFGTFTLASCTSEKAPHAEASRAIETTAEAPAGGHRSHVAATATPAAPADLMTKDGLPKDLVCMVNNAYMGKKQFPVAFEDKMYYGCCEMCVKTIQNERQVRYATDPVTGQEVDKSKAFIALKPGSTNGDVLYFASEENYKKYKQ